MLDNVRAGIVGGWAFGQWMAKVNHFPLICSFSGTFAVMDLVWDGDWVRNFLVASRTHDDNAALARTEA